MGGDGYPRMPRPPWEPGPPRWTLLAGALTLLGCTWLPDTSRRPALTGDPYDNRCHRCGLPLLDPVPFCSRQCEQAPGRWQTAYDRARTLWQRLFGRRGPDTEILWSLAEADLAPRWRPALADWLRLHNVYTDQIVWPLQVRRERDGTWVVDAGTYRHPLILPPPVLPGTRLPGNVRRSDTATPARKARP